MNDAVLNQFRAIADAMAGPEPRDWQWVGPYMSQRMFGITQERVRTHQIEGRRVMIFPSDFEIVVEPVIDQDECFVWSEPSFAPSRRGVWHS